MKARFSAVVPLCLLFAACSISIAPKASAQSQSTQLQPPNVLEVVIEYIKPGQAGTPHQKTEGAFVQAMRDAKWQSRYLGMNALTGRLRAVFFVPYNSFADWQKDNDAQRQNTSLASALDSATIADGALLEGVQTSVFHFRPDMSLRPGATRAHYFEATIFRVHPGHEKDWDTVVKMYKDAFEKNAPDAHWDMFEQMYGSDSGNTFVLLTPMKGLDEVDNNMMNDKKIADAVGPEQMGKMRDLASATADIVQSNLLAIDPKMSYPPDSWVQGDPTFWNQH